MKRGYLALYRKIQDHPFYKENRIFSKYEAWIDILMEVQHSLEPKEVIIGMSCHVCNYGDSLKSVKTWSKRWGWTESKTRRYFILLQKMNQIRTKSEGKTTRLSVINYSSYDPKRRDADEMPTEPRRDADGTATTDKNVNKVNNEKTCKKQPLPGPPEPNEKDLEKESFEKFWKLYDKKDGKKKCEAKWKKISKKVREKIFETLPAYILSTPDKQFRKNPLTYLNGDCWDNEIINNNLPAIQGPNHNQQPIPAPRTYAQCQDAEQRGQMARYKELKEQMKKGVPDAEIIS